MTHLQNWDDLRLIHAIAQSGSLAAAAERLGIDASTVFRRLGQIEARLGAKLFERHRSGYVLTAIGEEFSAIGHGVDARMTALALKLSGQDPSPAGDVRLTTNDTLLVHLLVPIFARLKERHPQIRLDIVLANQALNLSRRDADIAVRATDMPPETLVGRRIASIAWAIYGRHEDWQGRALPADRATADWVALGDNLAHLKVARYVHGAVPPEKVPYRINTVLGLSEAVAAGIGIGPLPCFIADRHEGLVRLAPPEDEFSTGLWLLTHPELRGAPRIRAVLDVLGDELSRLRPLLEGKGGVRPAPAKAAAPAVP